MFLTRAGRPVPGADAREGVALVAARRRKVARYPDLTRGGPQRLVVLAAEVGGRWREKCQQFLRTLLRLRVQRGPPPLRAAAAQGWARRWWSRLPCSEPSPAPCLESGPCRRCLVRQTRSRWVTCWTSRLRAPRAGCRCASAP